MRFKTKSNPRAGDYRTKTRFLLLPRKIGAEIRWLELASWTEGYNYSINRGGFWEAKRWIDNESPADKAIRELDYSPADPKEK